MKPTLFDLVAPPPVPDGPLGEFVFSNLGVFIAIAVSLFLLSCVTVAVVAILFFKNKKSKLVNPDSDGNKENQT